jgi:Ca2+-transporting ATPase
METLSTSHAGLDETEAKTRLATYGSNELRAAKKISPWLIFLSQFKDFLIILLLVAAVLSAILGEVIDAAVIMVIVVFASVLGFIQEYRAEKSMEALKKMAAPTASVIRNGKEQEIPARDLVPGDITLLRAGDRVPSDARLIEVANLRAEEASLTGESVPVEKMLDVVSAEASIGDRRNMVYAGTSIAYGRGTAVATTTGMSTEFGKIAGMMQEIKKEETPLEHNLDRVSKAILFSALGLVTVLGIVGVFRGHEILEMLIWAVSLAIAAVPEALPAVVTISLAIGVQRMVKRNALIKRLPAVETLGCTTVICSDKTGTLTQDQMTVRKVYNGGQFIDVSGSGYEPKGTFTVEKQPVDVTKYEDLRTLLLAGTLCNDTRLIHEEGWDVKGDPTEGALVVLAEKVGLAQDQANKTYPRIEEVPFSSERKRMTTIHQTGQNRTAYSKGAPEIVLNSCTRILAGGTERPMTPVEKEKVLSAARQMAGEALRVLGVAYRVLPPHVRGDDAEADMAFAGLVGMIDPPRPEVKDAIKKCRQAGIKPVMITGDHKLTAVAIGRELGLLDKGLALSGEELDKLSEPEFDKVVQDIEVYARVSPAHKMRVIEALTKKGHVVAMTGDGVNDAPALKKADIGVAMGITGTDVTKEAADMVLTDDNFASIVAAVEEGRGLFGNIKKYLIFLLSANLGEILLMGLAVLVGLPLPLVAVQILYVNLATDGLPAIALSVDPPAKDIMLKSPRPRNQGIFTKGVIGYIAGTGIWTMVVTLGVFLWALGDGKPLLEAQSMCFVALILVEFFNALNCRSEEHSIFKIGFFSNRWLMAAIAWEIALMCLIVYLPALQGPFNTYSLDLKDWIIAVASASSIFILVEISKAMRKAFAKRG